MTKASTATKKRPAEQSESEAGGSPPAPEFSLRVSDDKVMVLLDCPDPLRDLASTVRRIIGEFRTLELPEYPDDEFMTKVLSNICQPGQHLVDKILIMGEAPVLPQDGRLEWTHNYFDTGWNAEEGSEAIDFWEKIDNLSVSTDEKLLEMHPAIPGEPGLNVFGNKIPVNKPAKVRVRCGKGVSETATASGGAVFTAEISGRIRFTDNTLSIDDIYVIKGDVDLEQGNIHHAGSLQIEGDVVLGATIEAGGDIVIKGMIEPSNIRAGGSLYVNGGIVGSPETLITVGGKVEAKYIKEAVIRAESNITVTNEIAHSDIETRGKIEASRGRIAGGRAIARMGITVGEAGASGSSKTLLAAGLDPTLPAKIADKKEKLKQMEKARVKLREAVQAMNDKPEGLNEDEQILVEGLDRKAHNLGQALADGEMDIRRLTNEAMTGALEEIFMLRECWAGTTVQLGEHKVLVRTSIMKPRLAKRFKNRVRVVPMGVDNAPDKKSS